MSAAQMLSMLWVEPENTSLYDRDLYFGDWIDADHDGCNTRAEVLQQESLVVTGGGCPVNTRGDELGQLLQERLRPRTVVAAGIERNVPIHR